MNKHLSLNSYSAVSAVTGVPIWDSHLGKTGLRTSRLPVGGWWLSDLLPAIPSGWLGRFSCPLEKRQKGFQRL